MSIKQSKHDLAMTIFAERELKARLLSALKLARFALDRNIGDAPEPDDIEAYDAVSAAIKEAQS